MAQHFQVAMHLHPGHPQLKTLIDSFDALVQCLLRNWMMIFSFPLMQMRCLALQNFTKNSRRGPLKGNLMAIFFIFVTNLRNLFRGTLLMHKLLSDN